MDIGALSRRRARPNPGLLLDLGAIGLVWGVLLGTYLAARAPSLASPTQIASTVHAVLAALMGVVLSCGFLLVMRDAPVGAPRRGRVVPTVLTAAALGVLQAALDIPLERVFNAVNETPLELFALNLGFYGCVHLAVGGVLLLVRAVDATRIRAEHSAQLEIDRARAEASLLRAQVQPHFLFNAMNAIHGLMMTARIDEADGMLTRLAKLLRVSFRSDLSGWSTVADELAAAEHYTAIEETRFGERLRIGYRVPAELLDCRAPALCLLPLVEGVVTYATAVAGPIEVLVRVLVRRGRLVLRVTTKPGHGPLPRELIHQTQARVLALDEGAWMAVREGQAGVRVMLVLSGAGVAPPAPTAQVTAGA